MQALEVTGARLYCESVGSGPPLLMIPGGNGTAHIFGPIARLLSERFTVITYDRRGFARSALVGPQDYARRLQTDADDALAVIERVAGGPAIVFGPSSGAVVALRAMTQGPQLVDTLVAFEPPAMKQLANGREMLAFFDEVYSLKQTAGIPAALDRFNTRLFPRETIEHFARLRDVSLPGVRAAIEYWFEHELRQYCAADLDVDALRANADRIVIAAGQGSRGYPLHELCANLAASVGVPLAELPGAHTAYATRPAELAPALTALLDAKG
ncbi:MAG: alpha/beta hydrolase [Deltaproteobacteria bacterium]|nr:alpha/beta hydrolase [Deltaproteobacteria bacterium]